MSVLKKRILTGLLSILLLWVGGAISATGATSETMMAQTGLPESVVSVPGAGSVVAVVEKSTQTFFLYQADKERQLKEVFRFPCSTGKLPGRKILDGDQKTPEGVYFITGKYFEKDLSPVYGVFAFPVDYPNALDKAAGRTGYAIWLHGTDRELKPRDSNGCVALENENLKKVEPYISLNHTPIILVKKIRSNPTDENSAIREAVFGVLKRQVRALEKGTYHQYLGGYSPEFAPDISWWNRWRQLRTHSGENVSVVFKNIGIYRDGDYFVALFDEFLRYDGELEKTGVKKLYLKKKNPGEPPVICGENYKYIRYVDQEPAKGTVPLLATADKIILQAEEKRKRDLKASIAARVKKWATDWEKGNMAAYAGYYSDTFSSSGMDKTAWVERKSYLKNTYKYIRVEVENLNVRLGSDKIAVTFDQNYESSGYSASGNKTLVMVKEGKEWKIIQEIWKKS